MTVGRPPKVADQRQGHRTRAEIVVVPDLQIIAPKPPSGLLKASKERWEAYWASPVAQAVDLNADGGRLERWIQAVDEWYRVGKEFRKERVVDGSKGQPVLNPLGAYLMQLEAQIAKAESELGLTPVARVRLGIMTGQGKLTAMELNRRLADEDRGMGSTDRRSAEAWEAEWQEA